jgi:phage terminase large subunit GpA-like protein
MSSLSDQQFIKDALRLEVAKEELRELVGATADTRAAIAGGQAARALVRQALARLEQRWLTAIAGASDETRVHYLLSDTLHAVMAELGQALATATPALPLIGQRLARGLKPKPILTVSQWADRHRHLKSGTNSPGPWRTAVTPYLRAIMDDLSEHSPVRTVVFMKSAGVGGTEAMYNWIGYLMHHLGSKDALVVVPTLELRDRSFNPRLAKMLDESPALAGLVTTASRNRANRGDLLEYGARARLIKAGANSPDSLRSDHLPYVILDEVDAMPWDVGGEGDPLTLIANRQRTFTRAKTYMVSTPTLEGQSRIEQMYQRSDQRRYEVPCPHCHAYQPLEWAHLHYRKAPPPANDPHPLAQVLEAWYVCHECGAEIAEGHKPAMLAAGRWVARRPHVKDSHGYHLNALYAPIGLGLTWTQIAQKWESCQGDSAELKGFINTYLGQTWKEQGESLDDVSLISRLEDYQAAALPLALVSAGVDVQKDRLEATVVGWGAGEEAWVLDHFIIPGDTTAAEVWEELHDTLLDAQVQIAALDSGYNTSLVYDFCRRRPWCVAIKGVPGLFRPLVEDERRRRQRRRRKTRTGLQVEPIGVDQGKGLLYARLKLPQAPTPASPRPGYVHFPRGGACDDEYFAQLGAERLVTKFRGSRPFQEWVQTRPRNEALDCLVYALAAMRLSNVDLAQVTARRAADPAYTPRAVGLRPPVAEAAEGAAIKRRQSSWL